MTAALEEVLQDGLHDLSDSEYFGLDAVNRSLLWAMRQSPAHARHAQLNPPESPAFDMGSALHTAILEPEKLEARFVFRPEGIDGRTKDGRAALAAFRESAGDRTILDKPDAIATLKGVRRAVKDHPLAARLLHGKGVTEKTALWTDDESGVRCKAKYDRIVSMGNGQAAVVDIKTTDDASADKFSRKVVNFGYHVQMAHYLNGLEAVAGEVNRAFIIVAIEKTPPYGVAVYELDAEYREAGQRFLSETLPVYGKCRDTDEWPSYPNKVTYLEAPAWLK